MAVTPMNAVDLVIQEVNEKQRDSFTIEKYYSVKIEFHALLTVKVNACHSKLNRQI